MYNLPTKAYMDCQSLPEQKKHNGYNRCIFGAWSLTNMWLYLDVREQGLLSVITDHRLIF